MSAPASTRLRLTGEARCWHGDGRVVALERKDALLLAYVAIEGPTLRATLASLLWPDVDEERARANLRQRLFRLRKSLGFDMLEGAAVAGLRADVEVDLRSGDADAQAGELLAELSAADAGGLAGWLADARERRRGERQRSLANEASRFESAGQLAPALDCAQRLVDADPTSEHAHRRVMRLHYLRGDRAAALAAFERCRDVLRRALAVAPERETEALRARIGASAPQTNDAAIRPLPVAVLRPPRLIGREPEWRALQAGWSAGATTLIAGEAGMGKTRLLGDFVRAQAGALIVDARPGDARVPHALLSRLLRQLLARLAATPPSGVIDELARLLPELGRAGPLHGDADRVRFVDAVEALLRACAGEGLAGLAVDDLQFADVASVEVLQHLAAARIDELRWLVAFRPIELAGETRAFCDELAAGAAAQSLRLHPLDAAQIAELIDSLDIAGLNAAALAAPLARHTGGNPLFLLETLKLMLAPGATDPAHLPKAGHVTSLIGQRISRLSGDAVKLARCAAIAGADFSAELAAHVLGVRALELSDAWAELEAAQVLRDGAFAHDLILEAARDSVPVPIARQLHAEIAAFLEAHRAEPAQVAQHWLDAGDEERSLPWLIAAADRAAAAWRAAEEGALLLRAARITEGLGGGPPETGLAAAVRNGAQREQRADERGVARTAAFALLERAHRAFLQSSLGSRVHLEVLDALAASAERPLERGYAHFARADTLGWQGDGSGAEREARSGLAAIETEAGPAADALHIDLTSALANALFIQDRPGDGADAVRAAEPRLLALNDRRREIEHYGNLGVLLDAGNRHAEAQAALHHVIALARAQRDHMSELVLLSNLGSSLHDVGKVAAALEPLRDAYRLKQSFPELRTGALFVQVQLGNMHRGLGEYREALDWLMQGQQILGQYVPHFVAVAHNGLARLWLELGQFARAQQHLRQALEVAAVPPMVRALTHLLRARLTIEQSQRGAAAEQALAAADSCIIASTRYGVRAQAKLLACRLQEPDTAYHSATAVALEAGRLQMQGVRMAALSLAARCALAGGQPTLAAAHAVEALALWPEHAPDDCYVGEVWLAAFDSLQAAGDARAAAVLGTAIEWTKRTANESVPPEFRDSFLHRNPFNRDLLAAAARLGL